MWFYVKCNQNLFFFTQLEHAASNILLYLGGGVGVFTWIIALLVLSSRLKRTIGNRNSSNSNEKTRASKDYKWTPVATNVQTQNDKCEANDQMTDSEDEEPIKSTERSKLVEELRSKLEERIDEDSNEECTSTNEWVYNKYSFYIDIDWKI